jgi:hypothetical protein
MSCTFSELDFRRKERQLFYVLHDMFNTPLKVPTDTVREHGTWKHLAISLIVKVKFSKV